MGLIFILPFAAVSALALVITFKNLQRMNVNTSWWIAALVLAIAGMALGLWLALSFTYQPSAQLRVVGFPIPTRIFNLQESQWNEGVLPPLMRAAGIVTNCLCAVAVVLLPLRIRLYLLHRKRRHGESGL
jgi:hydrogenase/urease accessory protein HupE